jgi:uncharacterized membrane protein
MDDSNGKTDSPVPKEKEESPAHEGTDEKTGTRKEQIKDRSGASKKKDPKKKSSKGKSEDPEKKEPKIKEGQDETGTLKKTKGKKPWYKRWADSYREWKKFTEVEIKTLKQSESFLKMFTKFSLPFGMAIVFTFLLYTAYPELIGDFGRLFVFYFFNPAGMEVGVLYGLQWTELNGFQVVGFMLVIDTLTAIFLIWNFNLSRLLPFFGWIVWVVQKSAEKKIKKSKSFEKGRFYGLIIFVMVPAYGTGAILGGIVGKLLNMDPWKHLGAIFIGSTLRLTVMAIIIDAIFNYLKSIGWI